MSDVTWKTLVRRTADEGFGRFDDLGILQVYRPYLEECVTYKPSEEEINLLPPIVLREDETLREAFLMTLKLRKIGGPKAQRVVLRLIETELRQLVEQFQEYSKPGGIEVTEKGVPEWVQVRCWDTMDGHYIGTDSNLPSKYMDILGGYLKSHQRYLERTGRRDSVRTIFAERAVLEQDREAYPETYREFVEWHKDNQVELLFLSRSRAEELAEAHTTNGVTDMAYWDGELILLWRYMGNDRVRLQMSFIGEDLYRRCRSFLDAVANEAELFPGADG